MILSIITVNKNNAAGLEKTIKSVICQTNTDFEFIIIDGASDDNSVEIIKKYSEKINYWVSEQDTGIYNAMNKGICKATGDYCLFLNSGDYLISSETLNNLFCEINDLTPFDIFYSDRINSDTTSYKYPKNITINYLLDHPISHQNSILKRNLFLEHGYYNENHIISSDWEFFLKEIWHYKSKFYHINTNISIFDINGIGSKDTFLRTNEVINVYQNVFHELTDSILELSKYHKSTYFNIIENYGNTKFLILYLKFYKLLAIIFNSFKFFIKIFKNK